MWPSTTSAAAPSTPPSCPATGRPRAAGAPVGIGRLGRRRPRRRRRAVRAPRRGRSLHRPRPGRSRRVHRGGRPAAGVPGGEGGAVARHEHRHPGHGARAGHDRPPQPHASSRTSPVPSIAETIECLRRGVRAADLDPDELSADPARRRARRGCRCVRDGRRGLRRPVVVDADPKHPVALGAARYVAAPLPRRVPSPRPPAVPADATARGPEPGARAGAARRPAGARSPAGPRSATPAPAPAPRRGTAPRPGPARRGPRSGASWRR